MMENKKHAHGTPFFIIVVRECHVRLPAPNASRRTAMFPVGVKLLLLWKFLSGFTTLIKRKLREY
jgi:hypothetical protein